MFTTSEQFRKELYKLNAEANEFSQEHNAMAAGSLRVDTITALSCAHLTQTHIPNA
jgi:hypothetical protein